MAAVKVIGAVWLGTVGATAVWQGVIAVYGEFLGLYGIAAVLAAMATIVTSVGVLGVAGRRTIRWCRTVGQAIKKVFQLDEKLDEHRAESREHWRSTNERMAAGDERMTRIEGAIGALAQAEPAAVRAAVEAAVAPRTRPARRTDPPPPAG